MMKGKSLKLLNEHGPRDETHPRPLLASVGSLCLVKKPLPPLNVAQPPHLLRRGIHVEEDALIRAGQRGASDQEDHQHEVSATVVGDIGYRSWQ